MSVYYLKCVKHWVDGYDVSGDTNKLTAKFMADEHDVTTFACTDFHAYIAGLTQGQIDSEGFWYADGVDGPDEVFYGRLGSTGSIVTIGPVDGNSGSVAWFGSQTIFEYTSIDGAVGDPCTFKTTAKTKTQLVRGLINVGAGQSITGAISASSGSLLGVVGSTQSLHAAVHITTSSGTSPLTLFISGSTNSQSFANPHTWFTFDPITGIGGQVKQMRNTSSLVDTWFRAVWSASSTTSYAGVVSIGIR